MKPWKEFLETNSIKEESVANVASGGHIAGLGDDHPDRPGSGEPGFRPDARRKWWKEKEKKLLGAREKREERKVAKEKEFAENIKNKTLKMSWPSVATGPVPDTALPMAALANKKKSFKKT